MHDLWITPDGIIYNTIMSYPRVVLDTNVLVAALRSRRGASFKVLSLVGDGLFETAISVALFLEYEHAARRLAPETRLTGQDIDRILDYICSVAILTKVSYLWRPTLRDADDDMVLEVAVAAGCGFVVTFNQADFAGAERFGVKVMTPAAFLAEIGELS